MKLSVVSVCNRAVDVTTCFAASSEARAPTGGGLQWHEHSGQVVVQQQFLCLAWRGHTIRSQKSHVEPGPASCWQNAHGQSGIVVGMTTSIFAANGRTCGVSGCRAILADLSEATFVGLAKRSAAGGAASSEAPKERFLDASASRRFFTASATCPMLFGKSQSRCPRRALVTLNFLICFFAARFPTSEKPCNG